MPLRIWTAEEATQSWHDAIANYEQSVTQDGFVSHRLLLEFARRIAAKANSPDLLTWIGMGVLSFGPGYRVGEPNRYGSATITVTNRGLLELRLSARRPENVQIYHLFRLLSRHAVNLYQQLT